MTWVTKAGRARELQQRLDLWAPKVGPEAATLYLRGRWNYRCGYSMLMVGTVIGVILEATKSYGTPLFVDIVLTCIPGFFVMIFGGCRQICASALAGRVVGTSPKARPPLDTTENFEKWAQVSKDSALRARGFQHEGAHVHHEEELTP